MTTLTHAAPTKLPVDWLSASSIDQLRTCPTKWRKAKLERIPEPVGSALVVGKSAGRAITQAFQRQIDHETGIDLEAVQDEYATAFDLEVDTQPAGIQWKDGEVPGEVKDNGARAVKAYMDEIAPVVKPVAVERKFEVRFLGVEWGVVGYIDVEDKNGTVIDLKFPQKRLSDLEAAGDLQASMYLWARRKERNPATGFEFHAGVRTKNPYALIIPTTRTDAQLDAYERRIFAAAAEIQWRTETGTWDGPTSRNWLCRPGVCGYYESCEVVGNG